MFTKKTIVQSLAIAGLVAATGASQAAITVYTSLAAFTAAVTNPGTDTFAGFNLSGVTPSPLVRTAGSYSYTADALTGFFGAGTVANPWMSTNTATDLVTFGFGSGIGAFGGNFFGSDISGSFVANEMTISVTDSSGVTTRSVINPSTDNFLGFVSSTGVITAATLLSIQPIAGGFVWPTVDNLMLAGVAPIPEPGTYALLLAGLGIVGFMARRRG